MNTWIQVNASLRGHAKLYRLTKALNLKNNFEAMGIVVSLWLWASENAFQGDLSDYPPECIADGLGWKRPPEELLKGLLQAGLLDPEPLSIHDWNEHAAMLIDAVERNREQTRARVRRYRERKKEREAEARSGEDCNGDCNGDCNVTVTPCNAPTIPTTNTNTKTITNTHTNNTTTTKPEPNRSLPSNHNQTAPAGGAVDVVDDVVEDENFEIFWAKYPRKYGRDAAYMAWKALPGKGEAVLRGLDRWLSSQAWEREGGRFIPRPEVFLKDRRWQSPPEPSVTSTYSKEFLENLHWSMKESEREARMEGTLQ